jgi:pimeloyl-ACP methyl ester carboxylesterase
MPDGPRDLNTTLGGILLHYRDWGGAGQPIVLLHGLASTCHIWDLVAPILRRDFRVVALDQRGHGESGKPEWGCDFATVASDLDRFIAHLGVDHPVIVGHSWGGDVALEYAVERPSRPLGLCFVDGGTIDISSRQGSDLETAKREMAPPDFSGMTLDQLRERARGRFGELIRDAQREQIVLANFEVQGDRTIRARLSRANHMRIIEALWDHHPAELYPRVACPVLLMPARQNDDTPTTSGSFSRRESIARAEELLPISETVWLEDSVHDVPLQRPELVASVISGHFRNGFFNAEPART